MAGEAGKKAFKGRAGGDLMAGEDGKAAFKIRAGKKAAAGDRAKGSGLGKRLMRLFGAASLAGALILALGLALVNPPNPRDFQVSPMVLDRNGRPLHVALTSDDEWLMPESLADMGRWLPLGAVGVEDRRFFYHPGVDPLAVARAACQNLKNGRVVSGASTITVQLVRLSRPRPRTVASKLAEFLEAVRIDFSLSKDEILELYLNRAPFGGNLRGVGAASRAYFGKAPSDLSLGESATLVALLRGPTIYRPDRRPELARERRDFVLDLLFERGVISEAEVRSAKLESAGGERFPQPRGAPHAATRLLAAESPARWRWGAAGYKGLASTLEPDRQKFLEARLIKALADFPAEVTGAGLVMDNRDGSVLAHVGGAREGGAASFVDHANSRRSSGSTLKPFVYLAAFTESGLNPSSMLADTPLALGGSAPRNFDGGYRGPVSAGKALAGSLNAPAARVLRLAGARSAVSVMNRAGIRIRADGDYGDSLVLGGAETTLSELVGAYGTLARGGELVAPVYSRDDQRYRIKSKRAIRANRNAPAGGNWPANGSALPALDPGASWLVNQSLIDDGKLPPGLPSGSVAFKTGTSHGFRDAWLIAWTPDYTVGLWLGDSDGDPHKGLSGLSALGAAAVAVLSSLGPPSPWPDPPDSLERYMACPISGEPASPDCPGHVWAWRLARDKRTIPCHLHVREGGRVVLRWPPELAGFMAGEASARAPEVVSPAPGTVFKLAPGADKIPLKSEGASGVVHWYLDSEHVATAKPGSTPLITLTAGEHQVTMLDGREREAASRFTVLSPEIKRAAVLTLQ